jgi:prevent-host-death family protein
MEKIGVSTLRENLSAFLDKVKNGQIIMITSRGRDVAKIVPIEDKMEKSRETLRQIGKKAFIGDILSPIEEEWESMK